MMRSITVNISPEYRALVPRPAPDQYAALKESIKSEGLLMPIIVNQHGIVLDGHTRYDICKELGIKPRYKVKHFDDLEEERRFVVMVNLARRHLNLFQKCEVIYNWYVQEKKMRRRRGGLRAWRARQTGKKVTYSERLHNRVGKMLGTTHHFIFFSMYLIEHADAKMKNQLRAGTITLTTA